MLKKSLYSSLILFAVFANAQENISSDIQDINQPQAFPQSNINIPSNKNEFADSLAGKIDSKLEVINKQIQEAQQIKNSSLNIPNSQLLEEKRIEQFLPVMTGGYTLSYKDSKKPIERKALTIDEKGQKYYLSMSNNEVVKGINEDYLTYKNSESNKNFKSPMVLPNLTKDEIKVNSAETINSITPIVQDLKSNVSLPPISAVNEEIKKIEN